MIVCNDSVNIEHQLLNSAWHWKDVEEGHIPGTAIELLSQIRKQFNTKADWIVTAKCPLYSLNN